ncbi:MAG: nicotinamide riboside transporter PnuC [Flavobacteriales bacterium]|jgi:nicotinamide mononucleotide transporter|nr:nicotinamide riboside transporter PnuC [Flavobacteriales bacterium]
MDLSSILEYSAIILAILYVILATRGSIWCWLPAFVSSGIYVYLTYSANLIGESFISIFYVLMAVYGWWQWSFGKRKDEFLKIAEWRTSHHVRSILLGLVLAGILGKSFELIFNSAMPYLDAFTTSFSLIATFMVTRKILSNWIYWIVIDAFNIYLYWNRGLEPTAGLYVVYTLLAFVGFLSWHKEWKKERRFLPA